MKSLKGHLLAASQQLLDPNFYRTVILLLEHNAEGAAGVVLNRPTEATLAGIATGVLDEATDWDKAIRLGGPVPGPMIAVHNRPDLADRAVAEGIHSTIDAAKVQEIIRERVEPSCFFANYAGWGPGQLETELQDDSWIYIPARNELVFSDGEELWETICREYRALRLRRDFGVSILPDDPTLN